MTANQCYIGETKHLVETRIKEHMRDVKITTTTQQLSPSTELNLAIQLIRTTT